MPINWYRRAMRLTEAVAVLVVALILGGCFDRPAGPGDRGEGGTRALGDTRELDTSVQGCVEVLLLRFVTPDHARRFLPAGFEPADAASFFGLPAPVGRAMVSINAIECAGSALEKGPSGSGELVVLVEPPEVEGAAVEGALRNAYNVHQYVAGPGLVTAANGTGFRISQVGIEAFFDPAVNGAASGMGVLTDDEGELARFEVTAAPGPPDTATSNQFQITSTGLIVHEYAWADGAASAGMATCGVRAGSLIAEVLDTTTCDDADTIGLLFGPVDFDARFRYLPGVGVARATLD